MICVEWGHWLSKCPILSKLLPEALGLAKMSSLSNKQKLLYVAFINKHPVSYILNLFLKISEPMQKESDQSEKIYTMRYKGWLAHPKPGISREILSSLIYSNSKLFKANLFASQDT